MTSNLHGKNVLVVGASSGIGAATAYAFEEAGAIVLRPSRSQLDFTDDSSVAAFFAEVGPFDHVIITAAQTKGGSVESLELADAQASMNSKFFGAYLVVRAVQIKEGGSITLVSGFLSNRPSANMVLQGAINAALEALGRGLALERAPVRVNTVSPGLIDTRAHRNVPDKERLARFERVAKSLPAGRIGQPEDVARAILFVATSPFATGSTVTIDGGGTIAN